MTERKRGDGLKSKVEKMGSETLFRHRDIYNAEILRRQLETSGYDPDFFSGLHTTPDCNITEVVKGYEHSGFYDSDLIEGMARVVTLKCEFHKAESRWFWGSIV